MSLSLIPSTGHSNTPPAFLQELKMGRIRLTSCLTRLSRKPDPAKFDVTAGNETATNIDAWRPPRAESRGSHTCIEGQMLPVPFAYVQLPSDHFQHPTLFQKPTRSAVDHNVEEQRLTKTTYLVARPKQDRREQQLGAEARVWLKQTDFGWMDRGLA
ncbi:hypothetical protein JHW43_002656 [Diplocarpon mali]|nr:hypothetical protein JHW43_002656 [Diplocarpon mali]